jgi:hypothetical protein
VPVSGGVGRKVHVLVYVKENAYLET